ncbi:MAG TPA: glycosyltransferase N-terminal domain-containing protein [Candidatus Polarisedimenticolia bacterium]|nr:glycosyltransferase N-terminal domain-containing protein [Candidatus Polarisedimenticolia bacterium]
MDALYGAALRLAWVASIPYQIVMAALLGRPAVPWRERLGRAPQLSSLPPGALWVHAVSFGEVRLAHAVIAALRARLPLPVVLTTTTGTGRALAERWRRERSPGAADAVAAPPLDLPGPIGRFLDAARPRALVLVETELWPNLLRLAPARGVPVVVVNGRVSPRGFARLQRARSLFAPGMAAIHLVAAQSEEDAARFVVLGVPAERVKTTGNIKFDLPVPEAAGDPVRRRLALGDGATVFVAGSTARAEAKPVAEAFAALRAASPGAILVIAPRHPEDVAPARRLLERPGWRVRLWSAFEGSGDPARAVSAEDLARRASGADPAYDVVVVDTMGVLPSLYACATVAFVGGSLVTRGGQNLLEPAAAGVPVLFGPHVDTVRFAAEALLASGGGFQVADGAALAAEVLRLAGDAGARSAAGARARDTVKRNRGALDWTVALVAGAIGNPAARAGRR